MQRPWGRVHQCIYRANQCLSSANIPKSVPFICSSRSRGPPPHQRIQPNTAIWVRPTATPDQTRSQTGAPRIPPRNLIFSICKMGLIHHPYLVEVTGWLWQTWEMQNYKLDSADHRFSDYNCFTCRLGVIFPLSKVAGFLSGNVVSIWGRIILCLTRHPCMWWDA